MAPDVVIGLATVVMDIDVGEGYADEAGCCGGAGEGAWARMSWDDIQHGG